MIRLLLSLFIMTPMLVVLGKPSFAQGCGGWMHPGYSTYLSYTLGPAAGGKVTIYTRTSVDGSTSGICPLGCGCGTPEHIGQAKTQVKQHSNGALLGSNYTNGGYVPWSSYIGVSNTLNVVGVPGVVYDYAGTGVVICTAAGTLFNDTQTTPITADLPGYLIVDADVINGPVPPMFPNEWRQTTYTAHYLSGRTASSVTIGESFSYTQSNPPCNPPLSLTFTSCSGNAAGTNSAGQFTDTWGITSPVSPTGCGISNNVDHWQDCWTVYQAGAATYGTLTGYTHTDYIDINGHIMPPQSNQIPAGTRINP